MKNRYLSLIALATIAMAGCQKADIPNGGLTISSTVVDAGTPVEFTYAGDAQYISFFSGEAGNEYGSADLKELEGIVAVSFTHRSYNNDPTNTRGWMTLWYSTSYRDGDGFKPEQWTEITDKFNLGLNFPWAGGTGTNVAELTRLPDIQGEKVTFAFRCESFDGQQSRWRWNNFAIKSYIPKLDQTINVATFNPTKPEHNVGYTIFNLAGDDSWAFNKGSQCFMFWGNDGDDDPVTAYGTMPKYQPEEDWLLLPTVDISKTLYKGDEGVSVKTPEIPTNSWKHTYTTPGVYKVAVVVSNYATGKGGIGKQVIEREIVVRLPDMPLGELEIPTEVTAGEQVKFKYTSDAEELSFFSGEPYHEYANKDLTEIDGKVSVSFTHRNYNNDPLNERGWLELFYSTTHSGNAFDNSQWTNITSNFNLDLAKWTPSTADTKTGVVALDGITGTKTYFAFKCESKAGKQVRWKWTNFEIDIIDPSTGSSSRKISYKPVGPTIPEGYAEYNIKGDDTWDWTPSYEGTFWGNDKTGPDKTPNPIIDADHQAGYAQEEDWVVLPVFSTKCAYGGDKGTLLDLNKTEWSHTFTKAGTYKVTLEVKRYNQATQSTTTEIIEKTIKVN